MEKDKLKLANLLLLVAEVNDTSLPNLWYELSKKFKFIVLFFII